MEFFQSAASLVILSLGFPIGYYTLKSVPEEKAGLPYFRAFSLLLLVGLILFTLVSKFSMGILVGSLVLLLLYTQSRRNMAEVLAAIYSGGIFALSPSPAAFTLIFAYGLCAGAERFSAGRPFSAWPSLALLATGAAAGLL